MSATLNLTIHQRSSYGRVLRLEQPKGKPMDLTGWAGKAQIRATYGADAILAEFRVECVVGGEVRLSLAPDQTAALPVKSTSKSFVYDLLLISAGGQVMPLIRGRCTVIPGVTIP
jgi:hypothetical protein